MNYPGDLSFQMAWRNALRDNTEGPCVQVRTGFPPPRARIVRLCRLATVEAVQFWLHGVHEVSVSSAQAPVGIAIISSHQGSQAWRRAAGAAKLRHCPDANIKKRAARLVGRAACERNVNQPNQRRRRSRTPNARVPASTLTDDGSGIPTAILSNHAFSSSPPVRAPMPRRHS